MRFSRDWLNDSIDLSDLTDEKLIERFTGIGHALEAVEEHGDDTVFDLEITTNRVDAMSHYGMARELAAALGREIRFRETREASPTGLRAGQAGGGPPIIRIDAPEMCSRYSALVIRGVNVAPSPASVCRRLEAVGLRPINNIVDATNYVMLALGHPLHAFDLDKLAGPAIVVRRGTTGEKIRSLDGQTREIDGDTIVIADASRPIALGGIIGGAESEIGAETKNVLLECAWFEPSFIRRTARRLALKTDASYRFERRVDPNGTLAAIQMAAKMIVAAGGGTAEPVIDVVARETQPKRISVRGSRLHEAAAGAVGAGYALELFRRLGFEATAREEAIDVVVPTYRGDIHEEADLIEEVLRFFGLDNVPASLPRLTTGDARPNTVGEAEDEIRRILAGSGLAESVTYSFIRADLNPLFSDEEQLAITNSLSENIAAMRLSLLPGLLESLAFNRSYGTRDGGLFEIGRTYHRTSGGIAERHRLAIVMFGSIGSHWGDSKRPVDFFDVKGVVQQVADRFHVPLTFSVADRAWLRRGNRAVARHGERLIATAGFLASEVLQQFGIKGDVAAAEFDVEALLESQTEWRMAPVARFPGVPMILAMTHAPDLEYQRIVDTITSFKVPYLHEVGLRDRFVPEGSDVVKTTLGMWYQAFDRSLTQEEINEEHQKAAARVAALLPVKVLS